MEVEGGEAGSTLDAFLAEEGLLEEASEHAIRTASVWRVGRG